MTCRIGQWICVWLIVSLAPTRAEQNSGALLNDSEIRSLVTQRIKALGGEHSGVGIVVGTVSSEGRKIISVGERSSDDSHPPDGDTVFEIGSVTKVFTALLLADMAQKDELALNDPVAKYLPAGLKVPERHGRTISLLNLATHTAGLPFMPNEAMTSSDLDAHKYSLADLRHFVANCELRSDIGQKWEYSNIGYWLLSEALANRAGVEYQTLLYKRVIAPLDLARTAFALSPTMKMNFAPGHNAVLQPSPSISTLPIYSIMPAAGGLYSTANDLLKLLAVAMDYEASPLARALHLTWNTRQPMLHSGFEQGLGWTTINEQNNLLVVQDGGTFGCASSIAWDPVRRAGVVVLSNQVASVGDMARHLLRPNFPLEKPIATKRTEVTIDPTKLGLYVGNYEASGEGIFEVDRDGDSLAIRSPDEWGLPKLRLHPENRQDFFVAELPMHVAFQFENDGSVKKILIYPPRGQKSIPAVRLDSSR